MGTEPAVLAQPVYAGRNERPEMSLFLDGYSAVKGSKNPIETYV